MFMGTAEDGIQFEHDGGWDYADRGEIKFWQELPDGATDMKFFAVSPSKDSEKWPTDASYNIEAETQTITYTVPEDVAEQVDIMYAQKDLAEGEYTNTSEAYTNGVPLNFHHALSQIVFKAKIADKEDEDGDTEADYVTAHVNSITVKNVHGAGTFNMGDASSILGESEYLDGDLEGMGYDNTLWTVAEGDTKEASYTIEAGENTAWSEITSIEAAELTDGTVGIETALMLLPQNLEGLGISSLTGASSANEEQFATLTDQTGSYLVVNCRVEYKRDNGEVVAIVGSTDAAEGADGYYANLYIPIGTQWNPGYKYVYTLIFSADSGDPVKATVESVDEWNEYYENVPETGEDNTGDDDTNTDEGNTNNPLALNYNAADLNIGESVTIARGAASYGRMMPAVSAYTTGETEGETEPASTLTLVSADDNIASVNGTTITAVAAGRVTVTVTDSETGEEADVEINVLPDYTSVTLSEGIKTVLINPGSYNMGNTYNDKFVADAPVHNVTISEGFYMGQFEVTIGQFVEFVNQNSSVLKIAEYEKTLWNESGDSYYETANAVVYSYTDSEENEYHVPLCDTEVNHITGSSVGSLTVADEYKYLPVRCSWDGAAAFAKSVGGYLPHEEEWEYAARANTSTAFWWRNESVFNDCTDSNFIPYGQNEEGEDFKYTTMESLKTELCKYESFMYVSEWVPPVYEKDENGNIKTDEDGNNIVKEESTWKYHDTSLRGTNVMENRIANPWGLYELFGNVPEWCGNYDYNYEDGIQDEVNHMLRGELLDMTIWDNSISIEGRGVAARNCNADMNETGFRVAFSNIYSGSNSSVQTVSNN